MVNSNIKYLVRNQILTKKCYCHCMLQSIPQKIITALYSLYHFINTGREISESISSKGNVPSDWRITPNIYCNSYSYKIKNAPRSLKITGTNCHTYTVWMWNVFYMHLFGFTFVLIYSRYPFYNPYLQNKTDITPYISEHFQKLILDCQCYWKPFSL